MKCPICKEGRLNEEDYEICCTNCGAGFFLEYEGYYEEGAEEITCIGNEPREFLDKYGKEINKWRGFEKDD